MRVFAVRNESSKGLAVERGRNYKDEEERSFGGYHSGGLVVIAGSLGEAQKMFINSLELDDVVDFGYMAEMLEEISLPIGVMLFANGEC